MKLKIRNLIVASLMVLGLSGGMVAPAGAINFFPACGANSKTEICKSKKADDIGSMTQIIINLLLFIIGIVAVIMIIIGGIKYITSNGNSQQVTSAKDTVLYSVIGLVVALMAYAIVNFVLAQFI